MANYSTSLLVTAQNMLSDKIQSAEYRHKDYSLTKLALMAAPNFYMDLNGVLASKTSDQRTVEAYALTKTATDAITARAHGHSAAAFGDSQKITLSFATKGQEFKTSLKMADRNFIGAAQMLQGRLLGAWEHLLDTIESTVATYLNTNKSQVNNATSGGEFGTWDGTNYVWEVENSKQAFYYQYLAGMMKQNNYSGVLDVVCDPVGYALAAQLAAQGQGNNTNTSFQFGNMNLIESTSLTATQKTLNYIIPRDTLAMVTWIPSANRNNVQTKDYTYTNMMDPFGLGIQGALHIREVGADNSSTVGETQDVTFEYELTVDVAINDAPLSASNEATIQKAQLLY